MDATTEMMEQLKAQYRAAWHRAAAANVDLGDRLKALGATIYYDPEDDWFIFYVGKPCAETVTLEGADSVHARLDPETWKLQAIECSALHAFAAAHREIALPFIMLSDLAAATPRTFLRMPPDQVAPLADSFRELIPA